MLINYEQARKLMMSIQQTNGASYNPEVDCINPLSGYMVAVPGYSKIVPYVWNTLDLMTVVNQWLAFVDAWDKKSITGIAGLYIGIWQQGNKMHLDVSQRIVKKHVAVALGRDRKQLAIYDCYNQTDIVLRPDYDFTKKPELVSVIDPDILTDKKY